MRTTSLGFSAALVLLVGMATAQDGEPPPKPTEPVAPAKSVKQDPAKSRAIQRDLRAAGGGRKTHNAVLLALEWLKNHQYDDGRWRAAHFPDECKLNRCEGKGSPAHEVGVTSLALLCYLEFGYTHTSGPYRDHVRRGLLYLKSVQDKDGCFGARTDRRFLYGHACATRAMAVAYRITGDEKLAAPVRKAVAFLRKAQNKGFGWRYGIADSENDTSVTAWTTLALASAQDAGLEEGGLDGALAWVDKVTEPDFGRTGYTSRGGPSDRLPKQGVRYPVENTEALTAMGLRIRQLAGKFPKRPKRPKRGGVIAKGIARLVARPPVWVSGERSTVDLPYWYFGTHVLARVGGKHWKTWNDALKTALVANQRTEKGRDERGSWDPIGAWGDEGGRVYATALACLCLETYYRDKRDR